MRPAVLRAYIFGVVTGSLVTAALSVLTAPAAHAEVGPGTVDAYGTAICDTLSAYPSNSGVSGVAQFLILDEGYTADEAADIVIASVIGYCPQHLITLQRFADTYAAAGTGSAVA